MNNNQFADSQTLNDLNIPGRYKNNSIARLFDAVVTAGGRKVMDGMFQNPLTDIDQINMRSGIFRYFAAQPKTFPFNGGEFEMLENYLASGANGGILSIGIGAVSKKIMQLAAQDEGYARLNASVCNAIGLLCRFKDFVSGIDDQDSPYQPQLKLIRDLFADAKLDWLEGLGKTEGLNLSKLVRYDYHLRRVIRPKLAQMMETIFYLDVYMAVAAVGKEKGFSYAQALPPGGNVLKIKNLRHPCITNSIGNDLDAGDCKNLLFLTGANMAGKSTLMKSLGIAVYLAHMGFPLAADHMEFSVKQGLFTSINMQDNLQMGYSHFYAEVLRVKTVAMQIAAEKDLVVIFDELFKGTNVKDAYDATLAITQAFSEIRNSIFLISTHITEVGETLMKRCDNFRFAYLPTVMDGAIPRYTYRIMEGIATDRQGMLIIENEGILEILNSEKGPTSQQQIELTNNQI